ncbi:MAG: hypothetical protein DWQ35_06155 [Planctomycetota bacterium]|nr:MAG: hypothetical protein DWQ35_06155 [Planctomycetota bacterium]
MLRLRLQLGWGLALALLVYAGDAALAQPSPYPRTDAPPQYDAFPPPTSTPPYPRTPYPITQSPTSPYPTRPPGGEQQFEGAMRIATIGNDVVLLSDVLPHVEQILKQNGQQIPPAQLARVKWSLVHQAVQQLIPGKRVMQDFKRNIPADRIDAIREQVNKTFEEKRIPELMEEMKVGSRAELVTALRQEGSSLSQLREAFFERALVGQWIRQQVPEEKNFSHDELLEYYQANLGEFEQEAKVRWQQLRVRYENHPTKEAAYAKIAEMGNAIWQGKPFEQVAAEQSDGSTAAQGGLHDWTKLGSLSSKELEAALFSLPRQQLSPIIEGPRAFHIVRVIERVDRHHTPFRDAQIDIREKLTKQRRKNARREYLDRLEEEIRVWTVFDEPEFLAQVGLKASDLRR